MTEEEKAQRINAVGSTLLAVGAVTFVLAFRDMWKAKRMYDKKRTHLELTIKMMERLSEHAQNPEMTQEAFDAALAEERAFIDLVIQNDK